MALSKLAKTPAPPISKGPSCAVCRALSELPPAEAEGLVALMSNPSWTFKAIAEAVSNDPDIDAKHAWMRDIGASGYGRHATAGCAARVRLRPRK